MAKNQNIALNPQKISGVCGKLLCCIKYEDDVYTELKAIMPDLKEKVKTPKGEATVIELNIIAQKVKVYHNDNGGVEWLPLADIARV